MNGSWKPFSFVVEMWVIWHFLVTRSNEKWVKLLKRVWKGSAQIEAYQSMLLKSRDWIAVCSMSVCLTSKKPVPHSWDTPSWIYVCFYSAINTFAAFIFFCLAVTTCSDISWQIDGTGLSPVTVSSYLPEEQWQNRSGQQCTDALKCYAVVSEKLLVPTHKMSLSTSQKELNQE